MSYFYHLAKDINTEGAVIATTLNAAIIGRLHEYFVHSLHICDDLPINVKVKLSYLKDAVPVIDKAIAADDFSGLHWHLSALFPLEKARSEATKVKEYIKYLMETYSEDTIFIYTIDRRRIR